MSLRPLAADWRSLTATTPSPGTMLPAELHTPAAAWDYGAVTEPLTPTLEDGVVRLQAQADQGVVGIAVLSLNFGALLCEEAVLRPQDGLRHLAFAFPRDFGPCRLLVRTYDDAGAGIVTILACEAGAVADLPEGQRAALLPATAVAKHSPVLTDELRTWIPDPGSLFRPIGLGNTCEAKFQTARVMQFRADPASSELAFRLSMLPPLRNQARFGWELFDWQGTSLKAVRAYLERDFQGLFERADLKPAGVGVIHREFGTEHMHDFEFLLDHPAAKVTPQIIDAGHPAAQARFEEMAAQFQALLHTPGPYLYVHVCEDIPTEWDVEALVDALRARSPDHRFRLLFVGYEGSDTHWGSYAYAVADKAFRPRTWEKPAGREWEGPDAAWDAAFSRYRLAFPNGTPAEAPAC